MSAWSHLQNTLEVISRIRWRADDMQGRKNQFELISTIIAFGDWSTDEGHDMVFLKDGSKARTQLNDVNWGSHAIGVGILFNF